MLKRRSIHSSCTSLPVIQNNSGILRNNSLINLCLEDAGDDYASTTQIKSEVNRERGIPDLQQQVFVKQPLRDPKSLPTYLPKKELHTTSSVRIPRKDTQVVKKELHSASQIKTQQQPVRSPIPSQSESTKQLQQLSTIEKKSNTKHKFVRKRVRGKDNVPVQFWFVGKKVEDSDVQTKSEEITPMPIECHSTDSNFLMELSKPAKARVSEAAMNFKLSSDSSKENLQEDLSEQLSESSKSMDSEADDSNEPLCPLVLSLKNSYDFRPINIQEAMGLKKILFGNTLCHFPHSWLRASCQFNTSVPFLLSSQHNMVSGFMSYIQAHIIDYLVFKEECISSILSKHLSLSRQTDSLVAAISHLIWNFRSETSALLTIPSSNTYYKSCPMIHADGLTETLEIFEASSFEVLREVVKDYLRIFQSQCGVVLILYSLIFTRSVYKIQSSMQCQFLLKDRKECSREFMNFLLTREAISSTENHIKESAGNGVKNRCDFGFICYHTEQSKSSQTVGSKLLTPRLPIWIVKLKNLYVLLFCLNRRLVSDWKVERRFELHLFCSTHSQSKDINITIDTVIPFEQSEAEDDERPLLENAIRTKWKDCYIDWNGFTDFEDHDLM